jgi:hypothetical protein
MGNATALQSKQQKAKTRRKAEMPSHASSR